MDCRPLKLLLMRLRPTRQRHQLLAVPLLQLLLIP